MENFFLYSYLSSTIAYSSLLLFVLLRKTRNAAFIAATLCSVVWSASVAFTSIDQQRFLADTLMYETLRNAFWFVLLITLFPRGRYSNQLHLLIPLGILIVFTLSIETFSDALVFIRIQMDTDPRFFSHVLFAIIGLILIEQLYRNTPLHYRWSLKFLCLGLGAMFLVDLVTYSKSLLYKHLDIALWQSRGVINALITPLLAISLTRIESSNFTANQTVPRKTVFYTTILFGSGIYLILMSAVGYYLKQANAEWGETLQILFIFLALLLLTLSFTSGKIRALAKVYFGKHFFQYNYDYREEWLKISKALAQLESLDDLKTFIISTLTNLVESSGGGLWLKNDQGQFFLAAEHNLHLSVEELDCLKKADHLPNYLTNKQWVIDFYELAHAPEVYEDIDLSPWCYEDSQVWLIIPLFHQNHLEAFAVLTQPRVPRKLNWEDHDLLKTVGMQLANAIALTKASEALANNRQFETYHRLSAYLVHDLKNITAQISLIVKNADKHKHKPEFFDDTIETLNNVVSKMQHIVEQLKQGKHAGNIVKVVNLVELLTTIQKQHKSLPSPITETPIAECLVKADTAKLTSIITNLLQNAQDAIKQTSNGWVRLVLEAKDNYAVISIIDNGIGMDQAFIAERLFKPFDTTKGNAGMGIGAYEAKDYILKNGGQLNVESQPGQGTTFTVRLPLVNPSNNESS